MTIPARETRQNLALWFGFFAGPVAWAVQLQTVYALTLRACVNEDVTALHVVALLCLFMGLIGALVSYGNWQAAPGLPSDREEGPEARTRMLSVLGMMTGALF